LDEKDVLAVRKALVLSVVLNRWILSRPFDFAGGTGFVGVVAGLRGCRHSVIDAAGGYPDPDIAAGQRLLSVPRRGRN
jgi:hypothetical protein